MRCPRCEAEAPVWAQFCTRCGQEMFRAPVLEGPPGPSPAPAPRAGEVVQPAETRDAKDYRSWLAAGAVLAFVATLVVPPATGLAASVIGLWVYFKGRGPQRTQGLVVAIAGVVATMIGLALALWLQESGLLTPPT